MLVDFNQKFDEKLLFIKYELPIVQCPWWVLLIVVGGNLRSSA